MMLRRTLTLAPLALLLAAWAGSYKWSAMLAVPPWVAIVEKGAVYAVRGTADDTLHVEPVNEAWEEQAIAGETVNRWLPYRKVGPYHIVPLWLPAAPLAVLAWWGWGRRSKGRGFPIAPR